MCSIIRLNPVELARVLSHNRLPWWIRSDDAIHVQNYTDSTDFIIKFPTRKIIAISVAVITPTKHLFLKRVFSHLFLCRKEAKPPLNGSDDFFFSSFHYNTFSNNKTSVWTMMMVVMIRSLKANDGDRITWKLTRRQLKMV